MTMVTVRFLSFAIMRFYEETNQTTETNQPGGRESRHYLDQTDMAVRGDNSESAGCLAGECFRHITGADTASEIRALSFPDAGYS